MSPIYILPFSLGLEKNTILLRKEKIDFGVTFLFRITPYSKSFFAKSKPCL